MNKAYVYKSSDARSSTKELVSIRTHVADGVDTPEGIKFRLPYNTSHLVMRASRSPASLFMIILYLINSMS